MSTVIGVVGGTGLYEIDALDNPEEVVVDTPFGQPSTPIIKSYYGEDQILFLARHGRHHEYLPHEVNYRANIYALKQLGAEWILAINAAGSMREEIGSGDFVVPDQLIDFTKSRKQSFFENGIAAYPSMAEPYCPSARQALIGALEDSPHIKPAKLHTKASYICIEGPALSSRAESEMFRMWGADVIGMTNAPEAKLAREAELAYSSVCLITDYDCWKTDEEAVSAAAVLAVMQKSGQQIKACLPDIFDSLRSATPSELATSALRDALVTDLNNISQEQKAAYQPLIGKYLS